MTLIENDSPKVQYTGPFIKGQLLPLTFPYIATEDVKMIIDDKPAIFNVDYEIITEPNDEHPVAYPNSAYIKSDLPNAKQITLYRVTPLDQQAPFPQQSKFRSERVEQALDKLTMQQQEQEEQLSRCIIAPITLETFNGQLPAPAADQALKWNTEGTELENYDIIGEQEAFEEAVNSNFTALETSITNQITTFEDETNTKFAEFRTEINENLEAVLNAADKLENLDQQVQVATEAAATATASSAQADAHAEEAFMAADQAEDALEEIKQVIQDAEDTIDEIMQNCGLPIFAPLWSDHLYKDASFLRADNFSWHSADIYVTAYKEILKQYNNPEATEQTDGDIIYKLSPDGFRIVLASEHDKVLERYLAGERAWFYILDTENQRFKLPREKKTDGKYLYFYVGTYERSETEVDLGTMTDQLSNKIDADGGNFAGSGLEKVFNERGSRLAMFDTILKDHILTYKESKGLALQGTYVYKEAIAGSRYGYPDFYAKCLEEYNQATDTETVNGKTVKVHSNGHKFYDIADKTGIDEFFSTMGSAWFYGVDTENERIFLPRRNILNLTPETKINVYGDGNSLMLTGSISGGTATGRLLSHYAGGGLSHTFYLGNKNDLQSGTTGTLSYNVPAAGSTAYAGVGVATAEASDGKSAGLIADLENISTNQEYLYICVGNTVVDTSWVDVVTQVEGGVKDLEDKTNEGIEVLSNASNALRQTQITNCLLEVPQNIKLELNNGVLTLKAGSKVIVPNGFEADGTTPKFDEVTIANDISKSSNVNPHCIMFYDTSLNRFNHFNIDYAFSGNTAPIFTGNYAFWYDTANNVIKRTADGGVTWVLGMSFPTCIVSGIDESSSSSAIGSIDQVFNGMGYIGSTIWVDKGVKGLIPNGRNKDGTLNNIEFVTNKVLTRTYNNTGEYFLYLQQNAIGTQRKDIYNVQKNINEDDKGQYKQCLIGMFDTTDGVISNFQPKLPFRVMDYNDALLDSDKSKIAGWGMPSSKYVDLTLGASGTTYTAPTNGWVLIDKQTSSGKNIVLWNLTKTYGFSVSSSGTFGQSILLPVSKGDVFKVDYTATGATNYFRFIYAQGEV